jgi:hypothetical protein
MYEMLYYAFNEQDKIVTNWQDLYPYDFVETLRILHPIYKCYLPIWGLHLEDTETKAHGPRPTNIRRPEMF